MNKITFSDATRRDWRHLKAALADLGDDLRDPIFWLAAAIFIFFALAPWFM
jgi:hypothetical protein